VAPLLHRGAVELYDLLALQRASTATLAPESDKRQKVREIAMAWVCGERGHGHTVSSVGLACGDRHGMGVRPHREVCISVCAHACAGEPAGIENMHACEFKASCV
jgi:hypothetical protein